MTKLNNMLEPELLTVRSDPVPGGLQKPFPISSTSKSNFLSVRCFSLANTMRLLVGTFMVALAGHAIGQEMVASLDLGGSLTGLNQRGTGALYVFDLGYGDATGTPTYFAQSCLSTANITSIDGLDGLLTATYNNLEGQLSANLKSDLTLDLADNAINFIFPDSINNPTVEGFSTDTGLSYTTGLAVTGDPVLNWSISPGALQKRAGSPGQVSITIGPDPNQTFSGNTGTGEGNAGNIQNLVNNGLVNPAGQHANFGGKINAGGEVIITSGSITGITSNDGLVIDSEPVPEPSTYLASVMLLISCGMGCVRKLRARP
jgi:hypothetical protein